MSPDADRLWAACCVHACSAATAASVTSIRMGLIPPPSSEQRKSHTLDCPPVWQRGRFGAHDSSSTRGVGDSNRSHMFILLGERADRNRSSSGVVGPKGEFGAAV